MVLAKRFILLFDPEQESAVKDRIVPLFDGADVRLQAFEPGFRPCNEPEAVWVTLLPDTVLAELLPIFAECEAPVGFLPHPGMRHARLGYGIAASFKDAVEDIRQAEEPRALDVLYCNDQVVLNTVVLGDVFTLAPVSSSDNRLLSRLFRFARLVRSVHNTVLMPINLVTQKEKTLDTAAMGMLAVEHGRSSALTKNVLEDSAANDGMLHALVLAPRSLLQMLWFLMMSIFFTDLRRLDRFPSYVGYIKTASLTVKSPQAFRYSIDGREATDKQVMLSVARRVLQIYPGRHLTIDKRQPDEKEGFRAAGLTTGEAKTALAGRALPWIPHASTEDFKELFLALKENARPSEPFVILMILATLLATLGLFANSAPVIIGAMILAPLMAPIVSLSMGVLRRHEELIVDSVRSLAWGIGLALACAMLLTWVTPLQTINSEIAARLSPTLLDLGIAVLSGIAGAYAHARAEIAKSLAGVAIAVALVPPLAVAGIGIGWGHWEVFSGAFLLFLTNLAGIVLAAAFTFMLLGFSPFQRAKRGLIMALALVVVIGVPLTVASARMVEEHQLVRTLDGLIIDGVQLTEVRIQQGEPLIVKARMVSDSVLSAGQVDAIKHHLQTQLERPIRLEATWMMVR